MPDPTLVRRVHANLMAQHDVVSRSCDSYIDGMSQMGSGSVPPGVRRETREAFTRSLCRLSDEAAGMDVYVIDTDVIRIAMDVVCSTGIEAEWLDLIPEQGVFLWDGADLGASSPIVCESVSFARSSSDAGMGLYDFVTFVPSGVIATDRCRRAWPIVPADVTGWVHDPLDEGLYEPAQLASLETDEPTGLEGILQRGWMMSTQVTALKGTLPFGPARFNRLAWSMSTQAASAWVGAMPKGMSWVALNGSMLCTSSSSRTRSTEPGIGWKSTDEAIDRTRDALMGRGYQAGEMTLGGFGMGDADHTDGDTRCGRAAAMMLAAVFALRAHPELVGASTASDAPHLSKARRRRLERDGVDVSSLQRRQVTTIHLREQPARPSSDAEGHRDVDYSCRWIVHGHFTHQPCGPNRSERRLTWIAPYIKGPAGKPLKSDLERTVNIRL